MYIHVHFAVSGEANFSMSSTNLTVGGFTQPGVARALIDIPANTEKGLSQRFLWLFPAPLYEHIEQLGEVDVEFIDKMRNVHVYMCSIFFNEQVFTLYIIQKCMLYCTFLCHTIDNIFPSLSMVILTCTCNLAFNRESTGQTMEGYR